MNDRIAIGIDLGTTGTKVAYIDEYRRPCTIRNAEGEEITPSVGAADDDGRILVGREAYRMLFSQPERAVRDFKLKLASPEALCTVGGRSYTANDFTVALLKKIRTDAEEALGCTIEECVLTHPANFLDDQKRELMEAAEEAGLRVRKLLPEPSAAAIAYGLNRSATGTCNVFDLGGGTFDVSIARFDGKEGHILGTSGVPTLGGRDFIACLNDHVLDGFEKQKGFRPDLNTELAVRADLHERCEEAMRTLATCKKTTVSIGSGGEYATVEITRETFEGLTAELRDTAVKTCTDLVAYKEMQWSDIRQLVLVGGGSLIPGVKEAIERESGLRATMPVDPIRAVSYGAAIQAAIEIGGLVLDGRAIPAPKLAMNDVTSYDIGCIVDVSDRGLVQTVIVPRHSAIPGTYRDCFRLKHPDQTMAEFRLAQGNEGDPPDRCVVLGEAVLEDLPPDATLSRRIECEIVFDDNAMVTARISDRISGKTKQFTCDCRRLVTQVGTNPNKGGIAA